MPPESLIAVHREVQRAAKSVLAQLATRISASATETTLAADAYRALCELGFPETWYYNCPAFVLSGSRTCLSMSGRSYTPNTEPIGQSNFISVDLSPQRNGYWGDCARSFYVENGRVVSEPVAPEFAAGRRFLETLHAEMRNTVHPDMQFSELYEWTNDRIKANGFENLDFLGNVGHSIATNREDRQYIEATNCNRLGSVPFFTFEPHVRVVSGQWGFKHEDIFYFNQDGRTEIL